MASPPDITIDASTQSEKPNIDAILALTQLLREKRQAKAKEGELDTRLQSHERQLQSTKRKREAVEEQIKELEMTRRHLLEEEGDYISKRHELWVEQTKAKDTQNDIYKQMLQLRNTWDKFEFDKCEEAKAMFREAVEAGDAAVVKLLVSATALKDDEWIPFITASSRGDIETVEKLLLAGAEADSKDIIFGRTALSWASGGGHKAIVQLLLDRAVNINSTDNDGWTPMHWAAERGHEDVVRLLLDRGAKIGCRKTQARGHSRFVRALAFSPNAKLLASSSDDHTIKIWDSATGECQQILQVDQPLLEGAAELPRAIAFTHDSKLLVSGSAKGSINIWIIETGQCKQTLKGHKEMVQSLAVSHDSTLMVSGSNDNTVKIWDFATGICERILRDHDRTVSTVIFSHDSKLIASGSFDGHVKIWNSATGECLQTLRGWMGWEVVALAFSHDSKRIVSGMKSYYIKTWDVATGQCQLQMECRDRGIGQVVAFSPDSKLVVSVSSANSIYIWDSTTGKHLRKLQGLDTKYGEMAFSEDFKLIASSSGGIGKFSSIKLWDKSVLSCVICPPGELVERDK